MSEDSKGFDFERSLQELEELVNRMERGDLSLEDSLKHFERGIQLTRGCQQALKEAEQKVEILINQGGEPRVLPFDDPDESR